MIGIAIVFTLLLQAAPVVNRPSTVSGQIQTRDGFPAVAVRVSAIPAPPATTRAADGQNYWATPAPVSTALTNNQGRYRLANVPPGRYYIVAGMLGRATYYPAATEVEGATVVTVGSDTAETIDFKLALAHGGRLSGRVTPAGDGPVQRAVLSGLRLEELLEMPLNPDGTFTFGHVPAGSYLLSVSPTPPGTGSLAFEVGEADVNVEIRRQPLRTVTGRIAVERGPLPQSMLAFTTLQSHVPATINPDGTFTAALHAGQHQVDMINLPVGYSVGSVRTGAGTIVPAVTVADANLSGVVITLTAPRQLPAIRGRITGVAAARLGSAVVELTGPIAGSLSAPVQADGSFEFVAVTPGRYSLRVPQLPEVPPASVVASAREVEVRVEMPGK